MALSSDIISQFAKLTAGDKTVGGEKTVYGTIVEYNGSKYVKLDGSDMLTPVSSTTNVEADERVTVMIKNHAATITGNLSSPAARTAEVSEIGSKISDFEIVIADKVDTKELVAINAQIENLQAHNVEIDGILIANKASIEELEANKLSAEEADIKYANIDFTNIGSAAMEYFYSKSGLIENVTVGDQTITGNLVGVTISGDLIEGNTVVAEKLVIKGSDGLYYKLNTDGMKVETEQTDYNSINGSVIKAKSITATKISVSDLVAFDATIGGFKITSDSLYSGVKESVDNTTQGIYLDKTGQMAVGDSINYIKYYRDSDGSYKLAISADSITIKSESINAIIDEIRSDVAKANTTYVQYKEPTDNINPGDIWIRSQVPTNYDTLRSKTWGDVKSSMWGELAYSEEPSSLVWDGSKWVLTIDYKVVKDNQTSIIRTRDELSQKAEKTVVTALSELVNRNSTEIKQTADEITLKADQKDLDTLAGTVKNNESSFTQRADSIELRVKEVENSTPDELRNSSVTIDTDGVSVSGGEVDIKANSRLNVEAGGTVDIDGGEVNIKSNSHLNVESGGTVKIRAGNGEDSFINFGEAFSASEAGCSAAVGAFGSLSSGGETVLTADNLVSKIIISTSEPQSDGIIWLCPSLSTSSMYRAYTGGSRDKLFYNNTHSFALSCDSSDTLADSVFVYTANFSIYLINDGDAETGVVFSVEATKASDSSSRIIFPEYTVGAIRAWEQVDISVKLETSVNLCRTSDPINIAITARNVKSNRLYLQKETYVTLSISDKNASNNVQPCTIYYKPRRS